MNKLLKQYGFGQPSEYYSMVCYNIVNGYMERAKEQFKALPKHSRKECFVYAVEGWGLQDKRSMFLLELL